MRNGLPKEFHEESVCQDAFFFPVWIADRKSRNLIWTNGPGSAGFDLSAESLLGRNISDLLRPGQEDEGQDIMSAVEEGATFKAYLVPEESSQFSGPEKKTITGIRLIVQSMPRKNHFLLLLKVLDPPMIKELVNSNKDFMLISDPQHRILEITPNVYLAPILQKIPLYLEKMTALVAPGDFEAIQKKKKEARQYIEQHCAKAAGEWKTVFQDAFEDLSQWLADEYQDQWKKALGKGFTYLGARDISYLYLKNGPDLSGRDFAITCKVEQERPCRFSIIFNQAESTKWDAQGYSLGINPTNAGLSIILKKNQRFLVNKPYDGPVERCMALKVEKIGGTIRFFINNRQGLEYADEGVLPNRFNACGLLSGAPNTLSAFEIAVRDAAFDYSQTLQQPFRLSIRHVPGRTYDMSFIPLAEWPVGRGFPVITEAMIFHDVTDLAKIQQDRDALNRKNTFLKTKNYYGFVGGNSKIQEILDSVDNFADTPATVLLAGPTGSGKEILARAIHLRSNRRDKPFIKVDCASLPQTLLESELFGHEKGAFTGATEKAKGRFESAAGGTLFLDEIGNIDPTIQAKLLGFLEDHTVTPIGSTKSVKVDTRVIAATNAPLEELIKKGLFREDLYFRLKVIHVSLPPLKNRLDDIPLLIESFLTGINERNGTSIQGVSPQLLESLLAHDWPGNARELYNVLLNLALQKKQGVLDQRSELRQSTGRPASTVVPERVRFETILKLAHDRPYFSARDCCSLLPVSLHTIRKDLMKLVAKQQLTMEGKGPAIVYRLYEPALS